MTCQQGIRLCMGKQCTLQSKIQLSVVFRNPFIRYVYSIRLLLSPMRNNAPSIGFGLFAIVCNNFNEISKGNAPFFIAMANEFLYYINVSTISRCSVVFTFALHKIHTKHRVVSRWRCHFIQRNVCDGGFQLFQYDKPDDECKLHHRVFFSCHCHQA